MWFILRFYIRMRMRYDRNALFLSFNYKWSSDNHISDYYVYNVNVVSVHHSWRGGPLHKWQLPWNRRVIMVIGRGKKSFLQTQTHKSTWADGGGRSARTPCTYIAKKMCRSSLPPFLKQKYWIRGELSFC